MTASPTISPTPSPVQSNEGQSYLALMFITIFILIIFCFFAIFMMHSKSVSVTQKFEYFNFRKIFISILQRVNIHFTDPLGQNIKEDLDL